MFVLARLLPHRVKKQDRRWRDSRIKCKTYERMISKMTEWIFLKLLSLHSPYLFISNRLCFILDFFHFLFFFDFWKFYIFHFIREPRNTRLVTMTMRWDNLKRDGEFLFFLTSNLHKNVKIQTLLFSSFSILKPDLKWKIASSDI